MKRNRKFVARLMEEGFVHLENLDYDRAMAAGKKLKKLRHSSGYEILALAYAGKGRKRKAIKILERCLKMAPHLWQFWELLGNFQADLERFEKAQESYSRALECPRADRDSVNLNKALALEKQGCLENAMESLDLIDDEELVYHAQAVKLRIMDVTGRNDQAWEFAKELMQDIPEAGLEPDIHAYLLALAAQAVWVGGRDREKALELALKSLEISRSDPAAMWLVREMMDLRAPDSNVYEMTVSYEPGSGDPGYYFGCSVVAQTPDEALSFIRMFEPEHVRKAVRVDSIKVIKKKTPQPKVVYSLGPRTPLENNHL